MEARHHDAEVRVLLRKGAKRAGAWGGRRGDLRACSMVGAWQQIGGTRQHDAEVWVLLRKGEKDGRTGRWQFVTGEKAQ